MQNEKQKADPNPMPEIKLFELPAIVSKVAHALGGLLVPFHCEPHAYMSTHNRGGGPALDRELYEQPVLHGWNSNGDYQ